jgi:hypothetical protein
VGETSLLFSPANRMTPPDQVSALGEEVCSDCGEATRERGPFLLAGVAATASLVTSPDPDAARDLRLRVGVAWEP